MRTAGVILAVLVFATSVGGADSRRDQIARWYAQLADRDALVRASARQELMGLSVDELPTLRDVVAAGSLLPAQKDVLREVVEYVSARAKVLSGSHVGTAFLGISFPDLLNIQAQRLEAEADPLQGIPVNERFIGFVGYRYLDDGDIILAIGPPGAPMALHRLYDLKTAVQSLHGGDDAEIVIQRGKAILTVNLKLDSHPAQGRPPVGLLLSEVRDRADEAATLANKYWLEEFAKLVGDEAI